MKDVYHLQNIHVMIEQSCYDITVKYLIIDTTVEAVKCDHA
jgi:hypothetical protein